MTTLADTQAYATTPGGWLVVMAVMLPVLGPLVILFGGARHAERIAMTIIAAGALATAAIVYRLAQGGDALARCRRRLGAAAWPRASRGWRGGRAARRECDGGGGDGMVCDAASSKSSRRKTRAGRRWCSGACCSRSGER